MQMCAARPKNNKSVPEFTLIHIEFSSFNPRSGSGYPVKHVVRGIHILKCMPCKSYTCVLHSNRASFSKKREKKTKYQKEK